MGRWTYPENRLVFREREMRTLEARWDIDVPRSGTDEGEEIGEERVHLGLRLTRGRHEDPYMATGQVSVPAELGQISSETTTDT